MSRVQFAKKMIQFLIEDSYCKLNQFFPCTTYSKNKIPLYTESVEILLQFIEANNYGNLILPERVTTSSGAVLILIFKHFVIKIFNTQKTWYKVSTILSKLKHSNNIVSIKKAISKKKFHAISTEKLIPIVHHDQYGAHLIKKFDHNLVLKLYRDISKALSDIHMIGYQQGDCTWDNIGIIGENFVLFDFNCANPLKSYNKSSDVPQLIKSSVFNLGHNNSHYTEEKTYEFLAKLNKSNFMDGIQLYNNIMYK